MHDRLLHPPPSASDGANASQNPTASSVGLREVEETIAVSPMILFFIVVVFLSLGLGLWLLLGRGPRRQRAFRRAHQSLERGDWRGALDVFSTLTAQGKLSAAWQERLRTASGEAHQLGADQLLKENQFEEALRHALDAGDSLGLDRGEQRNRTIEAMLAEARRLFAAGDESKETLAVLNLLDRIFAVQTACAEASFWRGLCLLRQQQIEPALVALTDAYEQAGKQYLDPAFYLGLLLHRQGKAQESLRYLAEANRVDSSCAFVTCQMGISLVAAGGDSGSALRALQRALGPRGFGLWTDRPERAWVEAFPEAKSYVRRLAAKYTFVCPLLGSDQSILARQGRFALAQAYYRHGDYQESADLFAKLLQDSPPTVPLLRGLGMALARCERYDQAYKHLRVALEQEDPKDPFTAGYLALCGAMGKPTNPDDKPRNVVWAIRLMARYPVMNDVEWAGLLNTVHAEAHRLNVQVGVEEQLQLCDILAAVNAVDPHAAASYAHLAQTHPSSLKSKHAFLYVRAATELGCQEEGDLDLFGRAFAESAAARAFFAERGWNFDDAEYVYLERSSSRHPGKFPDALGAAYAARGESFLLERSCREEDSGRDEPARTCIEVLLRLAPASIPGHDRLARLYYRRGDMDGAVALLSGWNRLAPNDHWPLVRQAIVEQERGRAERRAEAIDRALGLTRGRLRAAVAFLGAKLALRSAIGSRQSESGQNGQLSADGQRTATDLGQPLELLQTCLHDDPDHIEALWCLAAVRSVMGDREGLARQAPGMNRPSVADARFHFLGAVCHLAAKQYDTVLELGQRAAADESLTVESQFLMAWAYLHRENREAAQEALQKVAAADKSPSAVYARALLGCLQLRRGDYEEAFRWWNRVEAGQRSEWHLDDPLRQAVLLSGLTAHREGRFEQAAERFRAAGKLGLRDRRLGPLLTLALVSAGQRLLYEQVQ